MRIRVLDAAGAEVAAAEGTSGSVRIDDVTPWRPGAAYLWRVTPPV
ncbi:hypothetical protein [Streptomyces sp. NBC_00120]|nr:hypothetical protein [Streptomyces sp. NBC_00120]